MMWKDCLLNAVKEGKISQKTADAYEKYFDDAQREAERLGKAGVDAYTFATSKAAERLMEQVGKTKKSIAADILRTDRAIEDIEGHTKGLYRGLQAKLGVNVRGGGVKESLVNQREAVYGLFQSQLTDMIEQLRSKNFGLTRDAVAPRDMVQEFYGKSSGKPGAKVNADAWNAVNQRWLEMMENEGVRIAKREDWFLPGDFNPLKLRAMGEEAYVDAMTQRWRDGRLRLRDFQSTADVDLRPGQDDDRAAEIFHNAYKNITTNGDATVEPGILKRETMADRYNRRRVFEWTTPDAYFDFQDTFGGGSNNLGDQFIRHLRRMSNDLGTARVLGGDPDRTVETLLQYARKKGELSDAQEERLRAVYFHASGKASEVVDTTLHNLASTVRQWLSGTSLGGAILGSTPDFAFLRSTAALNGLSSTKVIGQYLKEIGSSKRLAMQHGLVVDTGLRGLRDHFDEVAGQNAAKGLLRSPVGLEAAAAGAARIAGQSAEFVMRATGLEHHSVSGRNAFGHLMLSQLADDAGKPFAELNEGLQGFLSRYGISPGDWDTLRTKARTGEGLFLDPARLAWEGTAADREPALRLMGAVDAESRLAIPEANAITRAMILGTTKPGTWVGEARRFIQFKGFTLSVMLMHGWRMIDQLMDKQGMMMRGQYMAALGIEATVLGALAYQLKNIAAGKDPESMETADFWGKAFAMGGAGGMFSDQIKTFLTTASLDDASRLLSPAAGMALNTVALTGGNLGQLIHGQKTNAGREAANFGRRYALPRTWYTSLAVDRLAWDTLQRMWDPDASGAFSRIEQRQRKDSGTSFWWRPGQGEPARSPDLEAALRAR